MVIRLGDVVARCAQCDGTEFVHLDPGNEMDELSELLCATCEAPARPAELIVRIAADALNQAGDRLRSELPKGS